jgi:hypothetical protein
MEKKNCAECGKTLVGRSDKKFCDAYCRNSYNNKVKREDEKYIQEVNRIIRRNRRILKHLCPEGKSVVRKEILDQLGYKYNHFSGIYRTKLGTYYFCYDYGMSPFKENSVERARIVKKQNYVPSLSLW